MKEEIVEEEKKCIKKNRKKVEKRNEKFKKISALKRNIVSNNCCFCNLEFCF